MEKSSPSSHSQGKIFLQMARSHREFMSLDRERSSSRNSGGWGKCCSASAPPEPKRLFPIPKTRGEESGEVSLKIQFFYCWHLRGHIFPGKRELKKTEGKGEKGKNKRWEGGKGKREKRRGKGKKRKKGERGKKRKMLREQRENLHPPPQINRQWKIPGEGGKSRLENQREGRKCFPFSQNATEEEKKRGKNPLEVFQPLFPRTSC